MARHLNQFVLMGDSRNDQQAIGLRYTQTGYHFLNRANQLMGQCMDVVLNTSISSATIDKNLLPSNLLAATSTEAAWFLYYGVVNDIANNRTASELWNGYNGSPGLKYAIDFLTAAGMTFILVLEPGSTAIGGVPAQLAEVHKFNSMARRYTYDNPNLILLDFPSVVLDPTSATLAFKSGYSLDGTHATVARAWAEAAHFVSIMKPLVPSRNLLPASRQEVFTNGGIHFVNNPLFTTLTGGTTSGAGTVNGSVPSGYVANCDAGVTMTISSAAGAFGNDVTLTVTSTGAGLFRLSYDLASEVTGDIFESGFACDIGAGAVNFDSMWAYLQANYSPLPIAVYDGYSQNVGNHPAQAFNGLVMRTPPLKIPGGTRSWFTSYLQGRLNGAGSVAVTLRQHYVRKLISL